MVGISEKKRYRIQQEFSFSNRIFNYHNNFKGIKCLSVFLMFTGFSHNFNQSDKSGEQGFMRTITKLLNEFKMAKG